MAFGWVVRSKGVATRNNLRCRRQQYSAAPTAITAQTPFTIRLTVGLMRGTSRGAFSDP